MIGFPFGPWQSWLHKMNLDWLVDWIKDVQSEVNGKQDELTAGENITIENNVISATGGGGGGSTYTAGDGIEIVNNVISVINPIVKTNISFDDAVIPCLFQDTANSGPLTKEDGTLATLADCYDLGVSSLNISKQFLKYIENTHVSGSAKSYDYSTQQQTAFTYDEDILDGSSQVYLAGDYGLFDGSTQIVSGSVASPSGSYLTLQVVLGKANGHLYAFVYNSYWGQLSQQNYFTTCTLTSDIEFTQI